MLAEWGLESLVPALLGFLQDGYTQDQVSVMIQDTPEYKQRFSGNDKRRAQGLAVLSPRDYLSTEAAYRQILSTSGMPIGFYDQPSDFADWIGNDTSPSEISSRVGFAVDAANRMDANLKKTFQDWYGVGPNDLAAFFLDSERALPHITKIAKGAQLGADANRDQLSLSQDRAEYLGGIAGDRNVDELWQQASAAGSRGNELSSIHGGADYTLNDAEDEVFANSDVARRKRMRLSDMEQAEFGGQSGVGKTTLTKTRNY